MRDRIQSTYAYLMLFALTMLSALLSFSVQASVETGWMSSPEHPPVRTRFVITGQVDETKQQVEGFLDVALSDGWKTYWRSPGEGGIAPSIDWHDSENLGNVDWHWPYPQQFDLLGIHTLGYQGDAEIPMTLTVQDWSQPVNLKATLRLSSCTTICVLTDYPFELSFRPDQLTLSEDAVYQYAQAISRVPKASPLIQSTQAIWDRDQQRLEVRVAKSLGWHLPEMVVDGATESSQEYGFKPLGLVVEQNTAVATFAVKSWLGEVHLDGRELHISIKDEHFLAEQSVIARSGRVEQSASVVAMLGFAFLGGLIFNIMPCVLPVLGMKLSSVLSTQGLQRREVRRQFLASSAGILVSFWLLAAMLVGLKLTGSVVGWGIQFQSPWFIGLMALVTMLFGSNMLGLFEIRLSANTSTWLATRGGGRYWGHFSQGAFATLLATPCSAPFLGTAVAFALAASNVELLVIFTALAAGMAMPWLLVAMWPNLARALPKPGRWMNKVRTLFGLMLLATSCWLLYLLANHLPIFWIILLAVTAIVVLLARIKRVYGDKAMAFSGGILLFSLAGSLLVASVTTEHWATPLPQDPNWKPLSNRLIEQSVAQGKTVFVNVTADWCITCQANKIGVILQDPVYSTLLADNMVAIQGDWTHPDSAVTDYLRANGRYGVPFNIVYGPYAPDGIPLPVILTEQVVMDAMNMASKGVQ
ncbi:protein-disulfide reductase DsbD family protein [Vibrio sinaloensis]|uniref:protein-disulfide reductase DsbD family protein n=1 Tax=Photobacterium sp. (strain ATCC 43367) TaxID=379097 RepID=UPI00057DF7A0|nr:protein-disulfide reductase DsbD domain-containing protein [Vibrio sinaloensis]KHT47773.1 cytochrome C biogenesis protein [Vibrio sinaloensis]